MDYKKVKTDHEKARILLLVASGRSIAEAAKESGVKPNQARDAIARLCRLYKISSEIREIHTDPQPYLAISKEILETPRYALRKDLRLNMEHSLLLRSVDEINPAYISNLTAAMILNSGITDVGLSEIQEWLTGYGTSLNRKPPQDDQHLTIAKRAMYLLDSFGFDVSSAKKNLATIALQEDTTPDKDY